ncbi:SPFH domain-containing protein [bacterium]|nr:SPFH domain-containing protein [bacterium]
MFYVLIGAIIIIVIASIRSIPANERGVVYRFGRKQNSVIGPGKVMILPFVDRVERISIEPFSVSMPPQSAITKDEIPIQLQASLDAVVRNADLALVKVRDWRIHLMSQLQELMKEQLEELDFDRLDEVFPQWVQSIRSQLNAKANEIGVEIMDLQISNLSPRTKPSG